MHPEQTANSDTLSTYQVSSMQLVIDKQLALVFITPRIVKAFVSNLCFGKYTS